MLKLGNIQLHSNVVLAPMAGVTDRPFRQLCRQFGAGLAVSEMISANKKLWNTTKSRQRMDHHGEDSPVSVQILGAEPRMMAEAAIANAAQGAEIIDINMGCPAKKVCRKAAGSALLRDEQLVACILKAVVDSVDVPVSLKIRTGWDQESRNGVKIAQIAEDCGIKWLSIHGRTRACGYQNTAEYDTIAAIKQAISIPIFANGDIDSAQKAQKILAYTGADGVMIGRAAQGRPWIFEEINHYLRTGKTLAPKKLEKQYVIVKGHLQALYEFYGEYAGVRIARKHVGCYFKQIDVNKHFISSFNRLDLAEKQLDSLRQIFEFLIMKEGIAA